MTTSTATIETEVRDSRRGKTRDELLQRVEVMLFWRGDAPWTPCPSEDTFTFRCLGVRFGVDRWQLHLAEADRQLPGMSTTQRRELVRNLREALASTVGLGVLSFTNDLILEPA